MDISTYVSAVKSGQPLSAPCTGLAGRIIRGKKPGDFLTLTDDPKRKIVMLVGPDGLGKLAGKTGFDMLCGEGGVGYDYDYACGKINDGFQFKLVVFPETVALLATWENVVKMVGDIYPDVDLYLRAHLLALKSTSFADIERAAGYDFSQVEKEGLGSPFFMTHDRFMRSRKGLVECRAFLYFTVHLRELFSGDGYTYDNSGRPGLMEYIIPNKPLSELGNHQVVDLTVTIPIKTNTQGARQMTTATAAGSRHLPIPPFFDPESARTLRQVKYQEIAAVAKDWKTRFKIQPYQQDRLRIALLIIDAQNTFCLPTGELPVIGAPDDNVRLAQFIYRELQSITGIFPTLDTHRSIQIFHSIFWVNDRGENPPPMTIISLDDVVKGRWRPNPMLVGHLFKSITDAQRYALHYVQTLHDMGKYPLMVWTYHAMLGGVGHALVAAIEEAAFFHSLTRGFQTAFEIKGGNPLTENYSILSPEVLTGPNGSSIGAQMNMRFLELLLSYDIIVGAGQAASHCFAWTINHLLTHIKQQDQELVKKVVLLRDCTSPVVIPGVIDFTQEANEAFDRYLAEGMTVVNSTDPIESWPQFRKAA